MEHEVEIVQHPQVNGLNLFVISVEYRTPHLHRDFELNLVLDGTAQFLCSGASYSVQNGDVLLLNPNQLHEIRSASGITLLCLQIQPRCFQALIPEISSLYFDCVLLDSCGEAFDCSLQDLLLKTALLYMERPPYYELRCMGQLHFVIAQLLENIPHHFLSDAELRTQRTRVERLNRLMDYVEQNYMHKLQLSEFAQREGLTMSYLSHFIKENLNQTFQNYVTDVRFQRARKLLLSTDMRIIDICLECGFSDSRYLTQAFLQNTGMRPEEYRRQSKHEYPKLFHKDRYSLQSSQQYLSKERFLEVLTEFANRQH